MRCILQLADQPAGVSLTVGEIARREGISPAYAEKLLRILAKNGLTQSIRGANGGYALSRSPGTITLGEVSRALDGRQTWEDVCTRHTGDRDTCVHEGGCRIRPIWQDITSYVHGMLDAITVEQLLRGATREGAAHDATPRPISPESLKISPVYFRGDT